MAKLQVNPSNKTSKRNKTVSTPPHMSPIFIPTPRPILLVHHDRINILRRSKVLAAPFHASQLVLVCWWLETLVSIPKNCESFKRNVFVQKDSVDKLDCCISGDGLDGKMKWRPSSAAAVDLKPQSDSPHHVVCHQCENTAAIDLKIDLPLHRDICIQFAFRSNCGAHRVDVSDRDLAWARF